MKKKYKLKYKDKYEYENGFYLTCDTGRIGKFINHLEIYKKIILLPGDVVEFGVFKGASFVRLLSFRDLLENSTSRKIYGFDAFGEFPKEVVLKSDRKFIEKFETVGGLGIDKNDLNLILDKKQFKNYELIEGNIINTLPEFLENNPAIKFSLVHIDVDVLEPTKLILELLWERMVKGGIIMFDDYGLVEGETKAVDNFLFDKNIEVRKIPYYKVPSFIIK
jgi:hypothetical protein